MGWRGILGVVTSIGGVLLQSQPPFLFRNKGEGEGASYMNMLTVRFSPKPECCAAASRSRGTVGLVLSCWISQNPSWLSLPGYLIPCRNGMLVALQEQRLHWQGRHSDPTGKLPYSDVVFPVLDYTLKLHWISLLARKSSLLGPSCSALGAALAFIMIRYLKESETALVIAFKCTICRQPKFQLSFPVDRHTFLFRKFLKPKVAYPKGMIVRRCVTMYMLEFFQSGSLFAVPADSVVSHFCHYHCGAAVGSINTGPTCAAKHQWVAALAALGGFFIHCPFTPGPELPTSHSIACICDLSCAGELAL
eukprot:1140225-Pelagomonas_calceolata.AAC.4